MSPFRETPILEAILGNIFQDFPWVWITLIKFCRLCEIYEENVLIARDSSKYECKNVD